MTAHYLVSPYQPQRIHPYIVKHLSRKSLASSCSSGRTSSGMGGGLPLPKVYKTEIASSLDQGRRPANISRTKQPRDQLNNQQFE